MTAITLRQPWAALVASGAKRTENRTYRPLSVVGRRLAIHAGKYKPTREDIDEARRHARADKDIDWRIARRVLGEDPAGWSYGRVVAVAAVGEPRPGAPKWRWPLSDVRAATSGPVAGRPGLFQIPSGRIRRRPAVPR